jgi:hypothetical protein
MGMCSYVLGIKPKDEKYMTMKQIYDNCASLNIAIPKEVLDYFGDYDPDEFGLIVDNIKSIEWSHPHQSCSGIEVNLDDLPPDVRIIRFVNSW